MSILKSFLSGIARIFSPPSAFLQSANKASRAYSSKDLPPVRKGVLIEMKKMEYPLIGSARFGVRLPFKPIYLFKIECNDSSGPETIAVLADLTAQNEGAIKGMAVTVTTRQVKGEEGSIEYSVSIV